MAGLRLLARAWLAHAEPPDPMFTTCPNCTLTLALTANDLRVGQGYVRCGRCGRVFNALISLTEEQAQEALSGATASGTSFAALAGRTIAHRSPRPAEQPDPDVFPFSETPPGWRQGDREPLHRHLRDHRSGRRQLHPDRRAWWTRPRSSSNCSRSPTASTRTNWSMSARRCEWTPWMPWRPVHGRSGDESVGEGDVEDVVMETSAAEEDRCG